MQKTTALFSAAFAALCLAGCRSTTSNAPIQPAPEARVVDTNVLAYTDPARRAGEVPPARSPDDHPPEAPPPEEVPPPAQPSDDHPSEAPPTDELPPPAPVSDELLAKAAARPAADLTEPIRVNILTTELKEGYEEWPVVVDEHDNPIKDEKGGLIYHGTGYAWWRSDAKRAEGQFDRGRRQGLWTWWYENGELAAQGNFVDDVQDGVWMYWNADGTLQREDIWKMGHRVVEPR